MKIFSNLHFCKEKSFFLVIIFFLHFHKQRILFYLFLSTWFTFFLCCCQMSINYRFLLHSIPRWILILATLMMWFIDYLTFLILIFSWCWHTWFSGNCFGWGICKSNWTFNGFWPESDSMGIIYLYGIAQLSFNLLLPFLLLHSFHDPEAKTLFSLFDLSQK